MAIISSSQKQTFDILFLASTLASPLDSTTYYFGFTPIVPNTTDTNFQQFYSFPFIIKEVVISVGNNTVSGTTENSTFKIRNITAGTSTTVGTFKTNASATVGVQTNINNLNILIPAGNLFCGQFDTPAWVTNPTGIIVRAHLICEKQ